LKSLNVDAKHSARVLRQQPQERPFLRVVDLRHQAQKVRPHPAIVVCSSSLAGDAGGLAGRSSDEGVEESAVCSNKLACERLDVIVSPNVRPVLLQHGVAVGFDLDLAGAAPVRSLKA
jgi:hypothetical protein